MIKNAILRNNHTRSGYFPMSEHDKNPAGKAAQDGISYLDELPESILLDINEQTEERDLIVRETASAALTNLEAVLRWVEAGKLKVSAKTGRPTASANRTLGQLLQGGDFYEQEILDEIGPIQSYAWPMLLSGTGYARADQNRLKLTHKGKEAIGRDPSLVIRDMWGAWRNSPFLDEFSRVDQIKGQRSAGGKTLFPVHERRPALYDGLMMSAPGKWLSVTDFIRLVHKGAPQFEVAQFPWKLHMGNAAYGHLNEYEDQTMIRMRYVLAFLFEYAATMGIIDVAYIHPFGALSDCRRLWTWENGPAPGYLSRYDGLMFFSVNALGAFAMEMADVYDAAPSRIKALLTVLPNHDVAIADLSALSPVDRLFLEKTCLKKSSALWQVNERALLSAVQNGTGIDELQNFLESRSTNPIPDTVKTFLSDIKNRLAELQYEGSAHLIACRDDALFKMMTTDEKLSRLCRAAGTKHIVILPGKETQFKNALLNLGYALPQLR